MVRFPPSVRYVTDVCAARKVETEPFFPVTTNRIFPLQVMERVVGPWLLARPTRQQPVTG